MERRRHPRFELMAQVRVKRAREAYVVELRNISLSGALVDMGSLEPPRWLTIYRTVELHLVHPEHLESLEVQGRVVRIEGDGDTTLLAVEFVDIEPNVRAALERLMAAAHEDEDDEDTGVRPPPLPH